MLPEPRLYAHRDVVSRFAAFRGRPWERGGWLLGYFEDRVDTFVLTHATPPSSGTPFHVRIGRRPHRRYFERAWEASAGHVTFLGDWHTHPGGPPTPSERDEAAMRQLEGSPDYGESPPLIAIVATARWPCRASRVETRFYTLRDSAPVALEPRIIDELPPPADHVPEWK